MIALEAERVQSQPTDDFAGRLMNGLHRRPNRRVEAGALLLNLFGVARIADEYRVIASQNEKAAVAREAGQIGDVERLRDEQTVKFLVNENLPQAVAALGRIVAGHGSFVATEESFLTNRCDHSMNLRWQAPRAGSVSDGLSQTRRGRFRLVLSAKS